MEYEEDAMSPAPAHTAPVTAAAHTAVRGREVVLEQATLQLPDHRMMCMWTTWSTRKMRTICWRNWLQTPTPVMSMARMRSNPQSPREGRCSHRWRGLPVGRSTPLCRSTTHLVAVAGVAGSSPQVVLRSLFDFSRAQHVFSCKHTYRSVELKCVRVR